MAPITSNTLVDDDRSQAQRWLVHEKQPWLRHQRAADGQHLLLAAAQGAGLLAASLGQPREQGVDPGQGLRVRGAGVRSVGAEVQVVAAR